MRISTAPQQSIMEVDCFNLAHLQLLQI